VPSSYASRLGGFFEAGLPTTLGLRVPWLLQWLPDPILGEVLFAGLAATLGAVLWRRRRALELGAFVLLPFPFVYAASSFTSNRLEPRYLELLAPLLALLLAVLLVNRPLVVLGLAAAAALSMVALVRIDDAGGIAAGAPDVRAPAQLGPLLRTLRREHVTRAWADYWVAFRVTFLTHEQIIVAPTYSPRYPRYNQLVAADPRAAHIFVTGTVTEQPQRARLLREGFRRIRTGGFDVYVPAG
jgi:hypothetical protein